MPEGPAQAQTPASAVTDADVALYQRNLEDGCKESGRESGTPTEETAAFCGCLVNTLRKEMSHAEWQQAFLFASNRQHQEESRVIGAHSQKAVACRNATP